MGGNVTGMVVDRIDALVTQTCREMRADQARFVQPGLALLEHGRQFRGQCTLGMPFRCGQAKPLDERGIGFADGKEQDREPAPLRWRTLCRCLGKYRVDLAVSLGSLHPQRLARGCWIGAEPVCRIDIIMRIGAQEVALCAAQILDRDGLGLPFGQPV